MNVNEIVYHLTMNLFTTNDSQSVYHIPVFDNEKVYYPSVVVYFAQIDPPTRYNRDTLTLR